MKSNCKKATFQTKQEGDDRVKEIQEKDKTKNKKPIRCYKCPDCKLFHLTSITTNTQKKIRLIQITEPNAKYWKLAAPFFKGKDWNNKTKTNNKKHKFDDDEY